MAEHKSPSRKVLGWLSDARTVGWAATSLAGGMSTVTAGIVALSNFLAGMPLVPRAAIIVGSGMILFALLLVPMALLARRIAVKSGLVFVAPTVGQPVIDQPKREIGESNQRNDLTDEVAKLRADNGQLRHQLDNAKDAVHNRETWARSCHQKQEYGEKLPEFGPLDPAVFREMCAAVHELKPSLRETLAGADAVWAHLAAQTRFHAGDLLGDLRIWRVDRLEQTERRYFERVANALERVLENREGDPRPYIAGTYSRYRQWRREMAEVAAIIGGAGSLSFTPGYIPWMAAEKRFLEALKDKLARPELEPVQEVIDAYVAAHGPPEDLSK
jgi:hypothetical protein